MTNAEKASQKKIQKALHNPFYIVQLTADELKKYIAIRNAMRQVEELG